MSLLRSLLASASLLGSLLVGVTLVPAAAETPGNRISGPDRFATAAAIANESFPSAASTVYLARADVFADALAAGVLRDGPVLLVPSCGAPSPVVLAEIERLAPDQVVALGGPAAVCDDTLRAAAGGRPTDRVAGPNRYATAAAIAARAFPEGADVVYLASGADSPDAVAGGSLTRGPILLVPPAGPAPEAVTAEIARLGVQDMVVLGGRAAVADDVAQDVAGSLAWRRVSGPTRYETAVAIADEQFGADRLPVVYLARGDVFADAVASGSLRGGAVLLVPSCGSVPDAVLTSIAGFGPSRVVALGGPTAVCDATLTAVSASTGSDVVVPDTTVVLDDLARAALRSVAPDALVFDAVGAPPVEPGDVLVSESVPAVAPAGLLRRVQEVSRDGDEVVVTTAAAQLVDAVHEGSAALDVDLTPADIESTSGPLARAANRQPRQPSASVDVPLVDMTIAEELQAADGVTISGSLTVTASLGIEVDFDVFPSPHLQTFEFALELAEAADLELVATKEASWSAGPIELLEIDLRCFWTSIGPVPVSFCPELEVSVSADGSVTGTITMGAAQSITDRLGFRYHDGDTSAIDDHDTSLDFDPPSLQVDADASAALRADLAVEVYDLGGPLVFGEVGVRGEAEVVDTDVCWGLYGTFRAGLGGDLDGPLDDVEIPDLTLLDEEKLLLEDPAPHKPCGNLPGWIGTIDVDLDMTYETQVQRTRTQHTSTYDDIVLRTVSGTPYGYVAYHDSVVSTSGTIFHYGLCYGEPSDTPWHLVSTVTFEGNDPEGEVTIDDAEDGKHLLLRSIWVPGYAEPTCPDSSPAETTVMGAGLGVELSRIDTRTLESADTDPDPDRLVGTMSFSLADPPFDLSSGVIAYSATVSYDLSRDRNGDGVAD